MNMPGSKETVKIKEYHADIVAMLSEVEDWKKELKVLNDDLIRASSSVCSEYGDRIMETMQSKLFYLLRVLGLSTKNLQKHEKELADAMESADADNIARLIIYQTYCRESAEKINGQLVKYKNNTLAFIDKNCGTS